MNSITLSDAIKEMKAGTAQIIDVREPLEFNSNKLDGAINLPSTVFEINNLLKIKDKKLVLICQSGGRANMVFDLLKNNGFDNVFVSNKHMAHIGLESKSIETTSSISWTVDRQFRMTLGVLLVIFLFGYHFASQYFMIIPVILATGLVVTSIINKCYMKIGISMLPWNKNQEYKD